MIYKVLLAFFIIVEIVFIPLYLKAFWPKPNKKSLCFKMICSTSFVCIGVMSCLIADNHSEYAVRILIALALGWIGDYFLHVTDSLMLFIIGGGFFLAGHIEYIIVFVKTAFVFNPELKFVTLYEIVAFVILAYIFGSTSVKKFRFQSRFIMAATYVYGLFLITMLIKACVLGVTYLTFGYENKIITLIWLIFGGAMFFASDFSLGIMLLGGQNQNRRLKVFNIITYFGAQMLLASSTLFINA